MEKEGGNGIKNKRDREKKKRREGKKMEEMTQLRKWKNKKKGGEVKEGSLNLLTPIREEKSFSLLQFCLPTFPIKGGGPLRKFPGIFQ